MDIVHNPNDVLHPDNDIPTTGGLFRQPSYMRKTFLNGPVRRESGSTAEFTGVRNSISSEGSFSSIGSRDSFLSAASSNNGNSPASIEFPNVEHSNSGSIASSGSSGSSGSSASHFRKPFTRVQPTSSAVQPFASSLPRRSATAGPVPAQGSAARLPSALPFPSRTKMRLPTLSRTPANRVKNAGGSGSSLPVVENWMTRAKTPTPIKAFRRNTRRVRRRKGSRRKGSRLV